MRFDIRLVSVSSLAAMGIFALTLSAEARIRCNEGYQVVAGNEISTPYCRDTYLAQIARAHGAKVSDAAIRNNPNLKNEICRWIGRDNRVRDICNNIDGGSRGR